MRPDHRPGFAQRLLRVLLSPLRALRALCLALGALVLAAGLAVALGVAMFLHSLPNLSSKSFEDVKAIARQRIESRLEDKSRRHRWTEIKDINRNFLYAVVMSEDSGFFEHAGIDIDAMLDSLAHNIKARRYEFGASTISQQVAKNLFLHNEKTLVRKAKEVIVTERLERRFGKNEILELYLNVAEFGPDLFGVDAAARHYFGKAPSEINPAEGAFIALMLPSPRRHHFAIFENRNLTPAHRRKIRRILGDMLANDLISPAQYHEYARYDFDGRLNRSVARE